MVDTGRVDIGGEKSVSLAKPTRRVHWEDEREEEEEDQVREMCYTHAQFCMYFYCFLIRILLKKQYYYTIDHTHNTGQATHINTQINNNNIIAFSIL